MNARVAFLACAGGVRLCSCAGTCFCCGVLCCVCIHHHPGCWSAWHALCIRPNRHYLLCDHLQVACHLPALPPACLPLACLLDICLSPACQLPLACTYLPCKLPATCLLACHLPACHLSVTCLSACQCFFSAACLLADNQATKRIVTWMVALAACLLPLFRTSLIKCC